MARQNSQIKLARKLCLGVSVSALFAMAAPFAVAQESGDESEASERRLGAIEVTATRREGVTVQDVPIAVTAFDAELLEQTDFNRLNDLEQLSPSVQITQGQSASAGTSISIRGIGTGADNFGFEPAVGVFVDGVYRTRTGSGIQELPELAGVEVLRGPQGTLFGRNTSAGVVSIRTAKPTFDTSGYASVSYGNFENLEANVGFSGALSENWAGRIDAKLRTRDGFIEDVNSDRTFNDIDRMALRGQLLYEKGNTDLRLIVDYTQTDENCCTVTIGKIGALGPLVQGIAGANGLIGNLEPGSDNFWKVAASPNRSYRDEVVDYGASLEINHEYDFAKLTSITSLRNFDSIRDQDIDFSGIDRALREGTTNDDLYFTQELRLQGNTDRLDWLIGAFYLNEKIETYDTIQFGNDADIFSDASFGAVTGALVGAPLTLYGTGIIPGANPFLFTDTLGITPGGQPGGVVFSAFVPALVEGATEAQAEALGLNAALGAGLISEADYIASLQAIGAGVAATFTPYLLPPTAAGTGGYDRFSQSTNAMSIFTHNEYMLTDQLTLTAGLRYNYERKEITANLTGSSPSCGALQDPSVVASLVNNLTNPALGGALDPATVGGLSALVGIASLTTCNPVLNGEFLAVSGQSETRTENEITGTAKLSYEVSPDMMLFAGYSRGFKSGGFNLDRSSLESAFVSTFLPPANDGPQLSDLEFDSEIVNAYEAGFKSTFADGRVVLNVSGFYQDVMDFQENLFLGSNFVVTNTDVESFGVEVDTSLEPIDGLVIQSGFLWVEATRKEGANEGQQLGNTPEFVVTAQGTYTFPLVADTIEGFVHGNVRWQSDTNLIAGDFPAFLNNGAFATLGARIGVQSTDGKYALSAFGSNLLDEQYNVSGFFVPELSIAGAPTGTTETVATYPGAPRFWGVELKARF